MINSHFFRYLMAVLLILFFATASGFTRGTEDITQEVPKAPLTLQYPKALPSILLLRVMELYPEDYSGSFFTDHPQALATLIKGETDALLTGFTLGFKRFSGAGDVMHILTPVWSVSALMTSNLLDSLKGLEGGVVYAPFEGSPIDVYLKKNLARAGLTDKVTIAYAPFPQSAGLLAQKKIAGSVLVEPLASKLEIAGQAYRLENLSEGWARISGGEPRSPQASLFASSRTVEARGGDVAILAGRLAEATEWVAANPREAAEIYADVLGFPVPVVAKALQNTLLDIPSAEEVKTIISGYTELIGVNPPVEGFYAEFQ